MFKSHLLERRRLRPSVLGYLYTSLREILNYFLDINMCSIIRVHMTICDVAILQKAADRPQSLVSFSFRSSSIDE